MTVPHSKKKIFFVTISVMFITLVVLVAETTFATLYGIWKQEDRAYDTFIEHNVMGNAVYAKRKLYLARETPSSLRVKMLDVFIDWAYESATNKIPNDDFERLVYFYYYHLRAQVLLNSPDAYDMETVMPVVEYALLNSESLETRSKYTQDYEKCVAVRDFSYFYFIYGKKYLDHFDEMIPLEAIYHCAMKIDYEILKKYNDADEGTATFAGLYSAYQLHRDSIKKGRCDERLIAHWNQINKKIDHYQQKYWSSSSISNPDFTKQFTDFQRTYLSDLSYTNKFILTNCPNIEAHND